MRPRPRALVQPLRIIPARAFHQSMALSLRQRAVVSSFICTPPQSPGGLTFALFKRSEQVSTYRGKWAVCSGSIDKADSSPEAAARREILEETKLSDADLTLLRKGKPFRLTDQALNTEWTIHPFAFQLKEGAKSIQYDWEHTDFKFIKPHDMECYDHVPQLEVGMHRVMVSPETEEALAILRNDHESGAQALAVRALELLQKAINGNDLSRLETSEEFWKELRWRAWHLAKNGRPNMGAAIEAELFKALEIVTKKLASPGSEGLGGIPLTNFKEIAESAIKERISAADHSLECLAKYAVDHLDPDPATDDTPDLNIVTISSSGSITRSLAEVVKTATEKGRNVKITALESRPGFEGVAFVNNLLASLKSNSMTKEKLKIELVSDASLATALKGADFLVFGGDKVLSNGDVSNKIGTLAAAVLSKHLHAKCQTVALFSTNKIISSEFDEDHLAVEYNDPAELTRAWPSRFVYELKEARDQGYNVEVKNAYFEWVPAKFIKTYISEVGQLKLADIERLGRESAELEMRIFGDL